MDILASALSVINMLAALVAAIVNASTAYHGAGLDMGRRVVHGVSGIVSLYFAAIYIMSLLGFIGDQVLGPYYLTPALLAIFFTLIWSGVVDRKAKWNQKFLRD
jgi:hypothetical protein